MRIWTNIENLFTKYFDGIKSGDRKRDLFNVILVLTGATATFQAIAAITFTLLFAAAEGPRLALASVVFIVGVVVFYYLANWQKSQLAAWLFLGLLVGVVVLVDRPVEVVRGRSLVLLMLPIVLSSNLIHPRASFVVAGILSCVISFIEMAIFGALPNMPAMLSFFIFAAISFASSQSLENALNFLSRSNAELDEAYHRLSDLETAKGKIIAMAAAEVYLPIQKIKALVQNADPRLQEAILEQIDSIESLIGDVSSIGSITASDTFSSWLVKQLQERNWSMRKFAALCDLPPSTISRLINGEYPLTALVISGIATGLGLSVLEVRAIATLTEESENHPPGSDK